MNDKESVSFGPYLRDIRREKEITLESVTLETRIRPNILRLIEAEEIDKLPEPVLTKGFLRAYAKVVGAEPQIAVQDYMTKFETIINARAADSAAVTHRKPLPLHLLIKAGSVICIIILIIFIISALKDGILSRIRMSLKNHNISSQNALEPPLPDEDKTVHPPENDYIPPGTREVDDNDAIPDKTEESESEASDNTTEIPDTREAIPSSPSSESPSPALAEKPVHTAISDVMTSERTSSHNSDKKLVLKLNAVEETWMRITADNEKSKDYTLKSGDNLEIEAHKRFTLILGNASGVRLMLDDKPLTVKGKKGEVVKMRIP